MTPGELLVVNEAAQLKECESTIPLQLLGLHHAMPILVGDERQHLAMVQSKKGLTQGWHWGSAGHFVEGNIYGSGSYAFLNMSNGRGKFNSRYGMKNAEEVDVVAELEARLFRESISKKKQKLVLDTKARDWLYDANRARVLADPLANAGKSLSRQLAAMSPRNEARPWPSKMIPAIGDALHLQHTKTEEVHLA
ncbi:hypothetical protein POM88_021176 [Heracleum sosnowskyi]|uniref:DNA2/NAM7 helicase helicase domain-containing protein n=1 Tax=Heracleum sosnowskyi TaxID=360622 RepID=A0AAD8IEB9_9APIA|nr:hypothetical protein POM88_021176 [Heracleum sosnowskyi]